MRACSTDYANAVVQSLLRVRPLRDYFLDARNSLPMGEGGIYPGEPTAVVRHFGELCRKMCNPNAFKGHVSPLEFMQACQERSKFKYKVDATADAVQFLAWLLNVLHHDLAKRGARERGANEGKGKGKGEGKGKRVPQRGGSIVASCFQGEMAVTTIAEDGAETKKASPFLMLSLDLPPTPLFKDALETNIIPQIPLATLLRKFDGTQIHETPRQGRRKFEITRLPPHLILWVRRFTQNNFFKEKNPTIVTFPLSGMDVTQSGIAPPGDGGGGAEGEVEGEGGAGSANAPAAKPKPYDLVASVCHRGNAEGGSYRAHVHHAAERAWYEMEDLRVAEVRPEVVAISETYVQIYAASPR